MSHAKVSTSTSSTRLAAILDEYLAALHGGDAVSRECLLAEHPDLAEELDACLASLEFIDHATCQRGDLHRDQASVPQPLGDFEIQREIGRGGMGVVYQARQMSLARTVALKVLPFAAMLDPRRLQRFKNEALAAAALDRGEHRLLSATPHRSP